MSSRCRARLRSSTSNAKRRLFASRIISRRVIAWSAFLCSYTPLEIIDAAGASSVALCGTSDEVIPEAEKVLPANLCPLIKSTYGFAYSQKCPFTYFSDMIIGETTCDGKKKMYELLNELKRTHILHLPQGRDRAYEREGLYEIGRASCRERVSSPV